MSFSVQRLAALWNALVRLIRGSSHFVGRMRPIPRQYEFIDGVKCQSDGMKCQIARAVKRTDFLLVAEGHDLVLGNPTHVFKKDRYETSTHLDRPPWHGGRARRRWPRGMGQ